MSRQNVRLILGLIAIVVMFKACDRESGQQPARQEERAQAEAQQVDQQLTPQKTVEPREGLAAAIAIDVSGSMDESVARREQAQGTEDRHRPARRTRPRRAVCELRARAR